MLRTIKNRKLVKYNHKNKKIFKYFELNIT